MKRDDDQALWDLLGRATPPPVSPFFSRNVLRQIRLAEPERPAFLRLFWRRVLPAAAVVLVAASLLLFRSSSPEEQVDPELVAEISEIGAQNFDAFFELDDILLADEGSFWSDDAVL